MDCFVVFVMVLGLSSELGVLWCNICRLVACFACHSGVAGLEIPLCFTFVVLFVVSFEIE
jgi:hypothetical protein